MMGALQILQETHKNGSRVCETSAGTLCNYNNNNNTSICKAHNVSIRAESEAPMYHGDVKIITTAKS